MEGCAGSISVLCWFFVRDVLLALSVRGSQYPGARATQHHQKALPVDVFFFF